MAIPAKVAPLRTSFFYHTCKVVCYGMIPIDIPFDPSISWYIPAGRVRPLGIEGFLLLEYHVRRVLA
jgi:hypothetical protein